MKTTPPRSLEDCSRERLVERSQIEEQFRDEEQKLVEKAERFVDSSRVGFRGLKPLIL